MFVNVDVSRLILLSALMTPPFLGGRDLGACWTARRGSSIRINGKYPRGPDGWCKLDPLIAGRISKQTGSLSSFIGRTFVPRRRSGMVRHCHKQGGSESDCGLNPLRPIPLNYFHRVNVTKSIFWFRDSKNVGPATGLEVRRKPIVSEFKRLIEEATSASGWAKGSRRAVRRAREWCLLATLAAGLLSQS